MIVFQLKCAKDHHFEAWFRDGATYDVQSAAHDIECPYCGDSHVAKAPMAPNVVTTTGKMDPAEQRAKDVAQQILQAVGKLREHVEDKCENVGDKFAEEARRIHYGESEERSIYGEATAEEARELDEEGIAYTRIPWAPRKTN